MMDEEAAKAIQEAMNIFQKNAQEQQPPAPIETKPADQQSEEEPTEQPEAYVQEPEPPTVTELERNETSTSTHPGKKRHWFSIAGLIMGIISLTVIIILVIVPLFRPVATITIIPSETTIQTTTTIEVQGRSLSTVTFTQAQTVPTTGTGHQEAQAAHGTVTFYNGYTQAQTVPTGTLLQTANGVQIVTDQSAYVPQANPPMQGQATVSAHALQVGPAGNIAAYSIYGPCCRAYVIVQNTAAFTGGQDARSFPMVTQSDLNNAVTALKTSLMQSINATFQAQLQKGEAIIPLTCSTKTTSDHKAGEEANQVSTTITATCAAQAYQTQDVQAQVTGSLTAEANKQLGDGYSMTSDPQASILDASTKGSTVTLHVKGQVTMAYQFSQGQLQTIKSKISGMNKAQATTWLAHQPGIHAVSIEINGGDSTTLPQDINAIHCTMLYAA